VSSPPEWAAPAPRLDGPALLERAVGYTRGCLQLVAGTPLTAPTPCARWDLLALLRHMDDSLCAFTDAAEIGHVDLLPVSATPFGEPRAGARLVVERLRARACTLLSAWAAVRGDQDVTVSDRRLPSDLLARAGSLEIAVHGWDVARACGADRPLPAALALDLLGVVPVLVSDADRPARFAERVDVPPHAPAGVRLLAALGRPSS
jgi:uncharacterized protein (TIGR03086 family)